MSVSDSNLEASPPTTASRNETLRLWILADHKPGHTSQLHGLVARLRAHITLEVRWVDATTLKPAWWQMLLGRWPEHNAHEKPDIVVGAGSASHLPLLLARRAFGCMSVVLMRPAIPLTWFDAAIVPRHDNPPARDSILVTQGVMNTVTPRMNGANPQAHTILVGGISKHFHWSSEQVIAQIGDVVRAHPDASWTVTNSRRTPEDFPAFLRGLQNELPQLQFFPHDLTPKGWLATQLADSAQVWVTPDSVSMVYEAITSGAATGLFKLEPIMQGRIHAGLDEILRLELCTPFDTWKQRGTLPPPRETLWEAERAAIWLLGRYQVFRQKRRKG